MTKQELIKKISDFTDWSYQYSDDHSVYKKGKNQAIVLAKFGITTKDLIDAGIESTFTTNPFDRCSFLKNVLINDVFYLLEIVYVENKFAFFCKAKSYNNDKNGLFVCARREVFDKYFEENLDLREYENRVFKIIWESLE